MKEEQRKAMFAKKKESRYIGSINVGDNPEGAKGINKFIDGKTHEGIRGKILALKNDKTEAIILSMNQAFGTGGVKWGKMYHVKEVDPDQYPVSTKQVTGIPSDQKWSII